jgi:hypothetical protein
MKTKQEWIDQFLRGEAYLYPKQYDPTEILPEWVLVGRKCAVVDCQGAAYHPPYCYYHTKCKQGPSFRSKVRTTKGWF